MMHDCSDYKENLPNEAANYEDTPAEEEEEEEDEDDSLFTSRCFIFR